MITETSSGRKFLFSNFAKLLNKKVFGEHNDNLRQTATQEQLSELNRLESNMSALIKVGFIKTYQDAKNYLEL